MELTLIRQSIKFQMLYYKAKCRFKELALKTNTIEQYKYFNV